RGAGSGPVPRNVARIAEAAGVTKGALLDGVRLKDGFVHTHSLVMNSSTRTVREVRMRRPV
ncbi:MAG TPA: fructose-bisphosphatase class II, partial [Phenylobacterium sp.]|nr:fructose-bisphosphatase class II [Phenylobacterium sp.]